MEAFHSLDIGTEADIVYSFLFLAFGSVSSFCYIFLVLCVFIKPFGVLGDGVVFVTVFFFIEGWVWVDRPMQKGTDCPIVCIPATGKFVNK